MFSCFHACAGSLSNQRAFALADYLRLRAGAVHHCRFLRATLAAVHAEIHDSFGLLGYKLRIDGVVIVLELYGGREQREATMLYDTPCSGVVRNTYSYYLAILEGFRKSGGGAEQESERARSVAPKHHEMRIVNSGIFSRRGNAVAYHGQISLFRVDALDTAYSFYCLGVEGVAAYGIEGVGRVDHNLSVLKSRGNLVQLPV